MYVYVCIYSGQAQFASINIQIERRNCEEECNVTKVSTEKGCDSVYQSLYKVCILSTRYKNFAQYIVNS